jgi:fructosamine-3-kinase
VSIRHDGAGRCASEDLPISDLEAVFGELGQRMHVDPRDWRAAPVGGGSINRAWRVGAGAASLFLKVNAAERIDMFVAEAEGLRELERAAAIRVPQVIDLGCAGGSAFLALEWLDFGRSSASAERRLARRLAAQHRVTSTSHGWVRDNVIGSTPQPNEPCDDWADFFRERRLEHQLELARRNAMPSETESLLTKLVAAVPALLAGHEPQPSLLHGDLWSGNRATLRDGVPVVFDPAVYFGDRETDVAMTRLFGGFGPAFYDAYMDEMPLPGGWERRTDLYNLYHVLNHFNLFGSAYLDSAHSMALRVLGGLL